MREKLLLVILIVIISVASCVKDQAGRPPSHPGDDIQLKIAVVSDIHYLDPSLLNNNAASGVAFQAYLDADPKLIEFSDPIFRSVMTQLKSEKPDILLVPGDLTKDGERISHHSMARLLKQLANEHIKVYVVPGNHDINNPEARTYNGDQASLTPSVSASEFSTIYADFGYGSAIARDPHSLSYVAQPLPGLWILGIDDCEYDDNKDIAIIAGRIKSETMKWALSILDEAKRKHITVFGMMHHNIIEHYSGQTQLDPGYVTDNWETMADEFMNAGLSVFFTGHYHANDVTKRSTGNKELYDIETGSLVTAPSPFRILTVRKNELDISTRYVTSISTKFPKGISFPEYSNYFLSAHLDGYFGYMLSNPPYSLPPELVSTGAPLFRNAIMAHFAGDEKIWPAEQAADDAFGSISPQINGALSSLWTDLNPSDNQLKIKFQ